MKFSSMRVSSRTLFLVVSISGAFGIGMSGLIYGWFFCYACPYAVASCPIGIVQHSFVDMRLQGLWEGMKLLLYVVGFMSLLGVLTGRITCGWACPIGFLQDGVDWLRGRILPEPMKTGLRLLDSRWKFLKYSFLIFIPLTSYVFIDTVYTTYCPVGGITGTIPALIFEGGSWEASSTFGIKLASVGFFIVLASLFSRGWCRFLCPIGAFLALFNGFSFVRFENDEDACVRCGACIDACQMGLRPLDEVQTQECIMCGRCADACPHNSIELKFLSLRGGKKNE